MHIRLYVLITIYNTICLQETVDACNKRVATCNGEVAVLKSYVYAVCGVNTALAWSMQAAYSRMGSIVGIYVAMYTTKLFTLPISLSRDQHIFNLPCCHMYMHIALIHFGASVLHNHM